MAKRSAKEVWEKLVDEAGEELVERAVSGSSEQAAKELAAAGFDVAAEDAAADAFLKDLASGALDERVAPKAEEQKEPTETAPAKPKDVSGMRPKAPEVAKVARIEPRKRQPLPAWLLAAAAGALAGGGVVYSTIGSNAVSAPAPSEPSAADLAAAADLRRDATAACDASKWAECLADLDRARALDPGGDDRAPIKALRERAIRNIRGKP